MLLLATSKPFRRFILPGGFVLLLFLTLFYRQPEQNSLRGQLVDLNGQTMGTTFSIRIKTEASEEKNRQLSEAVLEELNLVIHSMSTYELDSELSRWNRSKSTGKVAISAPLATVLQAGLAVSDASGNAFDMTVQPLVQLWGFGPKRVKERPTEQSIQSALSLVGAKLVELDFNSLTLRKSKPDVLLDLSAIAKGYAVDRVSERLTSLGYTDHFVEIGGEVRTSGDKGEGKPWRIGVESPKANGSVRLSIALKNKAIATSGSYRNFRKYGDSVFSHTIDPRTGSPVTHKLISVSVIMETCMDADAWATALSVLGPEEGFRVASAQGLAATFLYMGDDEVLSDRSTQAFSELTKADIL